MKENSTEENIKLLEEFSNENVLYGSMVGMTLEKYKDLQLSTEHILSDYKRVLKENEELKNKIMEKELEIIGKEEYTKASMEEIIEQYYTANEDYISKRRIENIIDEIDYDIKKTKEIISNGRRNAYQIVRLRAMNTKSLDIKKRLQKLLESEKN